MDKEFLVKIDDTGVTFRNHFGGGRELLTPEKCMEIQGVIGSDVAMCLDDVPHYNSANVSRSTLRTVAWAERCLNAHENKRQLLFGIAQGSLDKKLRKQCTEALLDLGFDGLALGGLCIGEPKKRMLAVTDYSTDIIRKKDFEKPVYLMGVGSPLEILDSIERGVDIFDSCFPTRMARHGLIFTKKGNIKMKDKRYEKDFSPIEKGCGCETCRHFSRAYLHHLLRVKEPNAFIHLTKHNLCFLQKLITGAREAIKNDAFLEFKKGFS